MKSAIVFRTYADTGALIEEYSSVVPFSHGSIRCFIPFISLVTTFDLFRVMRIKLSRFKPQFAIMSLSPPMASIGMFTLLI